MISKIRSVVTKTLMPFYMFCMNKGMTMTQFKRLLICADALLLSIVVAIIWVVV